MASTNKTTNYQLSQFQSSDIPAWLTDYNGDMQKIDSGIHAAKIQADSAANGVSTLQTTVSGKQDQLTFDTTPISGSTNPVTSGGIYNALQNAQVQTDAVPTEGSTKAVQSGGVYTALQGKQDKLTFDSAPTAGSTNPVTSEGIYNAVQGIGLEIPVLNPTSGNRIFTARCVKVGGMLMVSNNSSYRLSVEKADFSQIGSYSFYTATESAYSISGNPLNLPTYSENSYQWLTQSSRQSYALTLFDSNRANIGEIIVTLRFDGTNTRVVYVVNTTTYTNWNTATASGATAASYTFISANNA